MATSLIGMLQACCPQVQWRTALTKYKVRGTLPNNLGTVTVSETQTKGITIRHNGALVFDRLPTYRDAASIVADFIRGNP
jgi:hypothetical protein